MINKKKVNRLYSPQQAPKSITKLGLILYFLKKDIVFCTSVKWETPDLLSWKIWSILKYKSFTIINGKFSLKKISFLNAKTLKNLESCCINLSNKRDLKNLFWFVSNVWSFLIFNC